MNYIKYKISKTHNIYLSLHDWIDVRIPMTSHLLREMQKTPSGVGSRRQQRVSLYDI